MCLAQSTSSESEPEPTTIVIEQHNTKKPPVVFKTNKYPVKKPPKTDAKLVSILRKDITNRSKTSVNNTDNSATNNTSAPKSSVDNPSSSARKAPQVSFGKSQTQPNINRPTFLEKLQALQAKWSLKRGSVGPVKQLSEDQSERDKAIKNVIVTGKPVPRTKLVLDRIAEMANEKKRKRIVKFDGVVPVRRSVGGQAIRSITSDRREKAGDDPKNFKPASEAEVLDVVTRKDGDREVLYTGASLMALDKPRALLDKHQRLIGYLPPQVPKRISDAGAAVVSVRDAVKTNDATPVLDTAASERITNINARIKAMQERNEQERRVLEDLIGPQHVHEVDREQIMRALVDNGELVYDLSRSRFNRADQSVLCDYCGQTFTRPSVCRRHVKMQHELTPEERLAEGAVCDLCGEVVDTNTLLKKHKARKHGVPIQMRKYTVSEKNRGKRKKRKPESAAAETTKKAQKKKSSLSRYRQEIEQWDAQVAEQIHYADSGTTFQQQQQQQQQQVPQLTQVTRIVQQGDHVFRYDEVAEGQYQEESSYAGPGAAPQEVMYEAQYENNELQQQHQQQYFAVNQAVLANNPNSHVIVTYR